MIPPGRPKHGERGRELRRLPQGNVGPVLQLEQKAHSQLLP